MHARPEMSKALAIKNLGSSKHDGPSLISHSHLPQPPFRLICCGPSHSGKSNMLKNMLTLPEYGYKALFGENIFIFSKTLGLDDTWSSMRLPKTHLYDTWDETLFGKLWGILETEKAGYAASA